MKNIFIILISLIFINCTCYRKTVSIKCIRAGSNRPDSLLSKYRNIYYEESPSISYTFKIKNLTKDTTCLYVTREFDIDSETLLNGGFYAVFEGDSMKLTAGTHSSLIRVSSMDNYYITLGTNLGVINKKVRGYKKGNIFDYMRECIKNSEIVYIPDSIPDEWKTCNCKHINHQKLKVKKDKNFKIEFITDYLD